MHIYFCSLQEPQERLMSENLCLLIPLSCPAVGFLIICRFRRRQKVSKNCLNQCELSQEKRDLTHYSNGLWSSLGNTHFFKDSALSRGHCNHLLGHQ